MLDEVDPLYLPNMRLEVVKKWDAASSKYRYYSNDTRGLYFLKQ